MGRAIRALLAHRGGLSEFSFGPARSSTHVSPATCLRSPNLPQAGYIFKLVVGGFSGGVVRGLGFNGIWMKKLTHGPLG